MESRVLQTCGPGFKSEQMQMCKDCGELFSMDEILLHQSIHIQYPHICVLCDAQFITGVRLEVHMKLHHSISKQHRCEVCGKECVSKKLLTCHKKSHSENCPFQCDICNRKFKSSYEVTKHKKIHMEDKKYVCDLCDYDTICRAYLEAHQKRHLGVFHFK
jgi:KRAB domain-containing zinc finger protein